MRGVKTCRCTQIWGGLYRRKWKLAIWGMILGTVIVAISVVGWIMGFSGAAGCLTAAGENG